MAASERVGCNRVIGLFVFDQAQSLVLAILKGSMDNRPHVVENVNLLHKLDLMNGSFNNLVALKVTQAVGTMTCAYVFMLLAIIGWPGLHASLNQWVQWTSQTLIQLTMLSVIMVGQNIQNKHAQLQADESFRIAQNNEHDLEQIMLHLTAIDEMILKIDEEILKVVERE